MALTVSYISAVKTSSGNVSGMVAIEMLDATHFVAIYGNSSFSIKAKYGTIAGDGSISYGAEATLFTIFSITTPISIGVLSSTKFVVFSRYNSGGQPLGKAYVCNVSGTTITNDGDNNIDGGNYRYNVCGCVLDSTHVAVTYSMTNDSSSDLMVKVGSVSGNSISWGSAAQCGTVHVTNSDQTNASIVALTSSKFVVAGSVYYESTCSLFVCDVSSGTTVTPGSVQSWSYSGYGMLKRLSDSTFLISNYKFNTTTLYSAICSVSSTTITFNAATSRGMSDRCGSGLCLLSSANAISLDATYNYGYGSLYAYPMALGSTTLSIGSGSAVIETIPQTINPVEFATCRVDDSKAFLVLNYTGDTTIRLYSITFPAVGPTNLKSLNTNLKANTKSYNTNLIANVKSINTNS